MGCNAGISAACALCLPHLKLTLSSRGPDKVNDRPRADRLHRLDGVSKCAEIRVICRRIEQSLRLSPAFFNSGQPLDQPLNCLSRPLHSLDPLTVASTVASSRTTASRIAGSMSGRW